MSILAIVLFVLTCLVAAEWTYRHWRITREKRRGVMLTPDRPGPPADAPRVSICVAAKDEADNIETCVRTLLAQDYPDFEVVVINDRSEDATAAIVERIAAEDPRVRLINIEHLPEGWCGKNHAMQTGVAGTDSEWLCMSDADCTQDSPRTLSVAMQEAADHDADLLSVLPRHEMHTFWENVVQPIASGVMMIWFRPDLVNDPDKPNAYANGAFMLMKRSAYEAIGTHEAVKDRVNEDMHMAARIKQAGLRLRVLQNDGLYRVRMYTSLRAILRGWGRIFFGTFGTFRRLAASLGLLVVMGFLPLAASILGFILAGVGAAPQGWWLACGIAGAVGVVAQLTVMYRFYELAGAKGVLTWSYPLGYFVTGLALINAMTKLRRGATVVWRNTRYAAPDGTES